MDWWTIFKRELRWIFVKDIRRAAFLFGSSLTYLLFFGLLYGTHVINAVPIVVCDEDQSRLSRALIQAFEDSERYKVVAYVTSTEEMERSLREKETYAALNIPPRFSHDVEAGLSSQVLLMVNGSNIAIANAVVTPAQEILPAFGKNVAAGLVERAGHARFTAERKVSPVDLRLRVHHNPTLSYLSYFLLGLAGAALQAGVLLAVGAGVLDKTANLENMSQGKLWEVMAGKLLPYWLCGIVSFILTMAASSLLFDVPVKGSPLQLLLLGVVFTFAVTAMGSLAALLCRDEVSYTQAVFAYAVPAFILSGFIWPIEAMDSFSRALSYLVPLTYTSDNLRGIMIAGYAPGLFRDIAALLAMGCGFLWLSGMLYGRRRVKA